MRTSRTLLFCILCFLALSAFSQAQDLPRRAFLGIQMDLNRQTAEHKAATQGKGVLITNVFAFSTAVEAGLRMNDILLKINEKEVNTPTEAIEEVRTLPLQSPIAFTVFRNGQEMVFKTAMKSYPLEQTDDIHTTYSQIQASDALLRAIINHPKKEGKFPAVVWVSGVSCYSLDTPFDTLVAQVKMARFLARNGFAVIRLDRPGLGDSKGKIPCREMDFKTEARYYAESIRELKKWAYVDSTQIFLIGHSMGGVLGPLIAKEEKVKGIVAYGTIGKPFIEYLIDSRRAQAEKLYQMGGAETDAFMRSITDLCGKFLNEKKSLAQIVKEKPDYQAISGLFADRAPDYWYQLHDLNIARNWEEFKGYTLLLWGKHDFISHPDEHTTIQRTIARQSPNKVTYIPLENTNHSMSYHETWDMARGQQIGGEYNPKVGEEILKWLKGIS
ncbi:MAG: alpha/beta fold hydrolase [Spirosomataceae bacterium]